MSAACEQTFEMDGTGILAGLIVIRGRKCLASEGQGVESENTEFVA